MANDAEPLLIAHVIAGLGVGGAERMLQRVVLSHSNNAAFRHHVFSLRGLGAIGVELREAGVAVEALDLSGVLGGPRAIGRLARRLGALRPDVVQCWMYHGDLIGGIAARRAGIDAVIWNVRASLLGSRQGVSPITKAVRLLCALLSRVVPARIVYVANAAQRVHEALGYDRSKGLVLPNGYALPPAADPEERTARRAEMGIGPDDILIGSVGRFTGLKDHRTFVAAASSLARHHRRARFALIGTGLTEDNAELRAWITSGGQADRFRLLGEKANVAPYYGAIDLFCLHSVAEGFPNVVAEAMAAAVPCVVTDVGDAADLVAGTGLVVPPADSEALAQAMSSMLVMGRDRRAELGRLARARIAAHFSMDAIRRRYETLYVEVAGDRASTGVG